jgi:hypothetical protein
MTSAITTAFLLRRFLEGGGLRQVYFDLLRWVASAWWIAILCWVIVADWPRGHNLWYAAIQDPSCLNHEVALIALLWWASLAWIDKREERWLEAHGRIKVFKVRRTLADKGEG